MSSSFIIDLDKLMRMNQNQLNSIFQINSKKQIEYFNCSSALICLRLALVVVVDAAAAANVANIAMLSASVALLIDAVDIDVLVFGRFAPR